MSRTTGFLLITLYLLIIILFSPFINKTTIKFEHTFSYPLYYFRKLTKPLSYPNPLIKPSQSYTIILIGDSMTERLGPNVSELRDYLKTYYPNTSFDILNYGVGSSNILSVRERLEKQTDFPDRKQPPILQKEFDLVILESFGQNPLSQFPLKEGIQKQTEELDWIIKTIQSSHPNSAIMFLATISPNRNRYAEGVVVLDPDGRHQWADERTVYIKNHISYAQKHNFPLANVFKKSLNKEGTGDIDFITGADFIHPSGTGVFLISKEIADTIVKYRLLPL